MKDKELQNLHETYLNIYSGLDEARVDAGLSDAEKRQVRTARSGRMGANLPNSSLHTGDIDRRHNHRETDDLHKDAIDIRKGKLDRPQFQGKTGKERIDQVKKAKGMKEELDIYDIVIAHLLDEGYAETPEAAEIIMVNMSEDWRLEVITERTRERKGQPRPDPSSIGHKVAMDLRKRNKEGLMTRSGKTVAQHERERGVKKVRTGRVEPKKPAITPAQKLAFKKDQEEKRKAATERMMSSRFD